MAVRKSVDSTFVIDKDREKVLSDCELALEKGKFKSIETNKTLYTLSAKYKTFKVVGEIEITLLPDGERTTVQVKSTGNMDNIFALFGSPGEKIAEEFKLNL
jgi:hypothetical protein